jgi:hypothetical protein
VRPLVELVEDALGMPLGAALGVALGPALGDALGALLGAKLGAPQTGRYTGNGAWCTGDTAPKVMAPSNTMRPSLVECAPRVTAPRARSTRIVKGPRCFDSRANYSAGRCLPARSKLPYTHRPKATCYRPSQRQQPLRPGASIVELEETWSLGHSPLQLKGGAEPANEYTGACFLELRILPEFAPCYLVTDRSIVLGWNRANTWMKTICRSHVTWMHRISIRQTGRKQTTPLCSWLSLLCKS